VDRAAAQMNNRLKSSSSATCRSCFCPISRIVPPLPSVDLHGGREIWERGDVAELQRPISASVHPLPPWPCLLPAGTLRPAR
jgi:hypothetical protein